jgi:hypothetical protein
MVDVRFKLTQQVQNYLYGLFLNVWLFHGRTELNLHCVNNTLALANPALEVAE